MPTDLDRLQGTWHVTSFESDGVKMARPTFEQAEIVVKGKTFTSKGMGATYKGTLEVKATTKPKAFDLVFTAGHAKGHRNLGIYTLDQDRWVICLATRGTTRPGRFATKAGTGVALETLARGAAPKPASEKPAKKEEPAGKEELAGQEKPAGIRKPAASGSRAKPLKSRAAKAEVAGSGAPTAIEGEWAMVSAVFDGKPMDAQMIGWCKRITRGDVTTVVAGPQTMLKARFALDPSAHPGAIDYVNLEGSNAGKSQAGIYALRDGLLRICMAAPGQPRPDIFVSKPGDGRSFTTWKLP